MGVVAEVDIIEIWPAELDKSKKIVFRHFVQANKIRWKMDAERVDLGSSWAMTLGVDTACAERGWPNSR